MRKITIQAIRAFLNGDNFKLSNTKVSYCEHKETSYLYLFNNLIAKLDHHNKELTITTAGWNTTTTRERLNGLPRVDVYQINWQLYLNGQPWDGKLTTIKL